MGRKRNIDWKKHLVEQPSSGITITDYCHKHGLSTKAWCYWKRKYKNELNKTDFIEVVAEDKKSSADKMVIKFANGMQLAFSEGVSPARLNAIVGRLSEL